MGWMIAIVVLLCLLLVGLIAWAIHDDYRKLMAKIQADDNARNKAVCKCDGEFNLRNVKVEEHDGFDPTSGEIITTQRGLSEEEIKAISKELNRTGLQIIPHKEDAQWWHDREWAINEMERGKAVLDIRDAYVYRYGYENEGLLIHDTNEAKVIISRSISPMYDGKEYRKKDKLADGMYVECTLEVWKAMRGE